jgi:hypothetical protein
MTPSYAMLLCCSRGYGDAQCGNGYGMRGTCSSAKLMLQCCFRAQTVSRTNVFNTEMLLRCSCIVCDVCAASYTEIILTLRLLAL